MTPVLSASVPAQARRALTPLSAPLTRRQAAHLLRRTGFGARPQDVNLAAGQRPELLVEVLLSGAQTQPLPEPPAWASEPPPPRSDNDARSAYVQRNNEWRQELVEGWIRLMPAHGLRERMVLLWHNHFVTQLGRYRWAVWGHRYLTLLRTHALGNFKAFVHAVGTDPAMLLYLDGARSRRGALNENYARELLELFTMGLTDAHGQPNYTQQDVVELARALTGWVVDEARLEARFVRNRHDPGFKTIFGKAGLYSYDSAIDLIFEERSGAIATHIGRLLYTEFVDAEADAGAVAELAGVLLANDWELAPAVRHLLLSERFYDEGTMGARVKSPIELMVGLMAETASDVESFEAQFFARFGRRLQQQLLNPPNVKGWPGGRTWIDTTTFPVRWLVADRHLRDVSGPALKRAAEAVHDPSAPDAAFRLPVALAEHLLPVPLEAASIAPVDEPFAGDLDAFPIPQHVADGPPHVRDLAKRFLADVPWYEWNLEGPMAQGLLQSFVGAIAQMPEYQLT